LSLASLVIAGLDTLKSGRRERPAAARVARLQRIEPIFSPSRQTSQTGQSSSLSARATA
jgi:hypothetical protein